MKLRCYTEKSGEKIRIELCGTMLETKQWQFLRDSCMDSFVNKTISWVTGITYPSDRRILIFLKRTPTKKQWKTVSEYWLNVMETRITKLDFRDGGVVYATEIPEETCDSENKTSSDPEPIPGAVALALHKSFYEQVDSVIKTKALVKEAKQRYEGFKNDLLAKQSNLSIIARFLDDGNKLEDGNETRDWENRAIEKGALEER